jgi:hypothetical protein
MEITFPLSDWKSIRAGLKKGQFDSYIYAADTLAGTIGAFVDKMEAGITEEVVLKKEE